MKVNKVIKGLITFDFTFLTSMGLVTPIFAIFITNRIIGGTPLVAGLASTAYMTSFSVARLSSAYIVDKKLSEKGKILLSVFGTALAGFSYLLYVVAKLPWHVYLLQTLNGVGIGLRYSPFMNLFTRYIDKGRESLEWGMVAVSTSLGQALTAAIGGTLTEKYGFEAVFTIAGILIVVSSIIPLSIHKELSCLKR